VWTQEDRAVAAGHSADPSRWLSGLDGWRSVPVTGGAAGRYTGALMVPASWSGRDVDLLAQATDAAGGSVRQQVTAAFTVG
jgi:hypothetical protein